jgi:hypothetical protein
MPWQLWLIIVSLPNISSGLKTRWLWFPAAGLEMQVECALTGLRRSPMGISLARKMSSGSRMLRLPSSQPYHPFGCTGSQVRKRIGPIVL